MYGYVRDVVSSLGWLIVQGTLAGVAGFIIGLVLGLVVVDERPVRLLVGVTCAIIGVWYVVWERDSRRS